MISDENQINQFQIINQRFSEEISTGYMVSSDEKGIFFWCYMITDERHAHIVAEKSLKTKKIYLGFFFHFCLGIINSYS